MMRYSQLARWLEDAGYRHVRTHATHRIFRNARGQVLTISGDDGRKQYSRAELCAIWREVRQHQQQQQEVNA